MNRAPHTLNNTQLFLFSLAPSISLVVIAGSLIVLLGWWGDFGILRRAFPGEVSMNPLTAITFLISGLALRFHLQEEIPRVGWLTKEQLRLAGMGLATVTVLLGTTKLLAYLTGWDPGFDQILFQKKLANDHSHFESRMAPNTAFCFILIGLSLIFSSREKLVNKALLVQLLALGALLLSAFVLIGYLYDVQAFYGVIHHIPMSIPTAQLFLVSSLGLLCIYPNEGFLNVLTEESPGGYLARHLLPATIVTCILLAWVIEENLHQKRIEGAFGLAVYTISIISILSLLIWLSARSIHRSYCKQREAEVIQDRIFNLSLDLLCVAGVDGYFKRVSPSFTKTLGYSLEEMTERPFLDFIHPDDVNRTLAEVDKLSIGNPTLQFENRYRHKKGFWVWLSWTTLPVIEEGLLFATARDVTEAKQTENNILKLNAELQDKAAQLQSANKELESFSYTVSHDLRAPLRHIQGYADLLTKAAGDQLPEKALRYLDTIQEASNEMGGLIDDLLAFSRLGRAGMHKRTLDLAALVNEVIEEHTSVQDEREIQWKVHPLPTAFGDPSLFRIVLSNLIGNAVKYSRDKHPAVIEIGTLPKKGRRHVIFVRDNGVGFDMEYSHKLFGVFQRLHGSHEFEGSGIGLATVHRIVTRHGGEIWAEGEEGKGATFYFTISSYKKPKTKTATNEPSSLETHPLD